MNTAVNQQEICLPLMPAHMHPADKLDAVLKVAVAHLEKVLNGCRTHAEQLEADKAARDFLSGLI